MFSKILKYEIYNNSKNDLLDEIYNYDKVHIISGNPEVLFNGLNNNMLFQNFTSKQSIIIPDGVGVVISSKIVRQPVKEKIAGIEVMEDIIKNCEKHRDSVYFLGTDQDTLEKCVDVLKKRFPNLKIAGYRNGFFDMNNCTEIINEIEALRPNALFVAMGCPRQETFVAKYMDELPCKVFMGVGGSFDVIAGKVNRAPKWMIKLGLEWLYRVSKEPWRIKRLSSIPKFILKVIYDTYISRK